MLNLDWSVKKLKVKTRRSRVECGGIVLYYFCQYLDTWHQ